MPTPAMLRVLLAGSVLSASLLAGCGRSDPASAAIKAASEKLSVIAAGPNVAPLAETREQALKAVLALVQPHLADSAPATAAGANLVAARVQAGLGEIKATLASDLERQAGNQLAAIRSLADIWVTQNARAVQAGSYDPRAELVSLQRQQGEIAGLMQNAMESQHKAEAIVLGFEREAERALGEAKAKRDQAAQIKTGLASATATGGLALLEQAAAILREADALELRVADINNQALAARPSVDSTKREVELLKSRGESTAKLIKTVGEKGEARKAAAAEARKAADEAASALAANAKSLGELRGGEIASTTEAAVKHFRDAAAAAKKAREGGTGDGKATASLINASANQSMGDALRVQAKGDLGLSATLTALLAASGEVPGKAALESLAKDLSDRGNRNRDEAKQAYAAAKDGFSAAGGKAEIADRIEKITKVMESLSTEGDVPAPVAAPAEDAKAQGDAKPADGAAAAATPAAAGDDAASVEAIRKMLTDLNAAVESGDATAASAFFAASTPEQEKALEAIIMPGLNISALNGALKAKFNASLADVLAANPMTAMVGNMMKGMLDKGFKAEDLEIKVTGDKGVVTSAGTPPQNVVKMGPQWLVEVPSAVPPGAAEMMKPMGEICGEMAGEVKAGKYATKEEFAAAFMAKLGPIMQKMMPPGMPGRGPKPPTGG